MAFSETEKKAAIQKLREAYAMDCTVREACLFADISVQTLYNWFDEDSELKAQLERLKDKPFLKARKTIIDSLEDPKNAQWYLERKLKKEFAQRSELTGKEGGPVEVTGIKNLSDDELESIASQGGEG